MGSSINTNVTKKSEAETNRGAFVVRSSYVATVESSTYHTGVERHGRLAKPPTGIANQNDHGATSSAVLNNDYPSAEASHNTSTTPHISPIEGPSRLNVSTSNTTETQNNLAPRKLRTNGLDILLEPLSSAEKLPSLGLKRNVRDLESTSRGELWGSKETAAPGEVDEISLGTLEQNAYTGGERGSDVINDGRKVHNQMRSETGDIRALDERLKRIEDRMSTLEKKLNELVEFAGQILAMSNEHYRLSMEKYYGVSC
ncbi:hypothetical protein FRC07_004384 [Ceratobasidium sp. 392]|nr:hypothetical protein FRC07_004384 [Ceratobasidium sp. 392]